jgi:D-glycero-D-manno-heptose 1,7-bisphosphate phosphatase
MNKSIFMDRDGVINELVYDKFVRAPLSVSEYKIKENVLKFCKDMISSGYKLFLVSNQPDYAKGYCNLKDILEVHYHLHKILISESIYFTQYYYCYHHPNGVIKEYSFECKCRKPSPYNVLKAINKYDISQSDSFFIGDRESDMQCGKSAELNTILIKDKYSIESFFPNADFIVNDINDARKIVLQK